MSEFTYEPDCKTPLEKLEWDSVWWESTNDNTTPRVLYIGDSISCDTRGVANNFEEKDFLFDGFGTSKALDNPFFKESVRIFAAQQGERALTVINNGLHGFHLNDETEYPKHYEEMILFLKENFGDKPIALVLTTLANEKTAERVKIRNQKVVELAQKYNLPIIDFYTESLKIQNLKTPDNVHFTKEGSEHLANFLCKRCKEILGI